VVYSIHFLKEFILLNLIMGVTMSDKIVKVNSDLLYIKDYELIIDYLLGKIDPNKYILHLYKDENEEGKYNINLTDDDYSLMAIKIEMENFENLFDYNLFILDNKDIDKTLYDNIEEIKKIYGIEDISYNSDLNEKLKNALFKVNNQLVNYSYVFFENYVYELFNASGNNFREYEIFKNNSNLKNCIINNTISFLASINDIIIKNNGNVFKISRQLLTKKKIML